MSCPSSKRSPVSPAFPGRTVREYLSAEQLAEVGPWSIESIQTMVRRGALQRGVHYFQPQGPRTKMIFKWTAIVNWIEAKGAEEGRAVTVAPRPTAGRAANGRVLDVEQATAALQRLLH
jgi:hypothetical protein